MRFRTHSPTDTRSFAAALATALQPGDLVLVVGELGSGKTTFVQGLAVGLSVHDHVTSPTFTIVQEYEGRIPLVHVDVYRLERMQELHDVGFEELVDSGRVTVVEWGDLVEQVLPRDRLVVRILAGDGDDERTIGLELCGCWKARRDRVEAALAGHERVSGTGWRDVPPEDGDRCS